MLNIFYGKQTKYGNGKYEFVNDTYLRTALETIHRIITRRQLWEWLATFDPLPNQGFLNSDDPNIHLILRDLEYDPTNKYIVSGQSFVIVMRIMKMVATRGYVAYRMHYMMDILASIETAAGIDAAY